MSADGLLEIGKLKSFPSQKDSALNRMTTAQGGSVFHHVGSINLYISHSGVGSRGLDTSPALEAFEGDFFIHTYSFLITRIRVLTATH